MRYKSHRALADYLLLHCLPNRSPTKAAAFRLGCTEPDRNPATYLKGSLRCQWLRGHNYNNAIGCMEHLAHRLERHPPRSTLDYYRLGKLIHYTADAFTAAHNAAFPRGLRRHREYEAALQVYFLRYLSHSVPPECSCTIPAAELIRRNHEQYLHIGCGFCEDSIFALSVCCMVTNRLAGAGAYRPEGLTVSAQL